MSLHLLGHIELPENENQGGFDHAAFSRNRRILYVVHTCNDALDVIDSASDRYLRSVPNLKGVAGALICDEQNLVFTSNRAENTVSVFAQAEEGRGVKIAVGQKPNGRAMAVSWSFWTLKG